MRLRLRLGPLPCAEARVWTSDTLALFDRLEGEPGLPFALPREAWLSMRAVVAAMHRRADVGSSFFWDCDTTLPELKTLVTYWLNLGKLSADTLDRIGGEYSGEVGERFHARLLSSLLDQLDDADPTYAARLRAMWGRPVDGVVDLREVDADRRP